MKVKTTYVRKEHRQPLMGKIKELVYAETKQVLNTKYQELISDKVVISYPKFPQELLVTKTEMGHLFTKAFDDLGE